MREFSKWVGREIERVCQRNDHPRPGKALKPSWEKVPPGDLYRKIDEEVLEMVEAYMRWLDCPTETKRESLQWELADVAATAMMLSARLDPIMSGLRRGKIKGRWVRSEFKKKA